MQPLPFSGLASVAFWIAFVWAFAAEGRFVRRDRVAVSPTTDKGSMQVVLIANGVGIFLAFLFAFRFPEFSIARGRALMYVLGIASLVAGGWLRRHCFRMLGASFTYDVRATSTQAVVEHGAYRFVRHPSYAAGILLFLGIGLSLTNWASLAVSLVLPAAAYGYRISVEEHALVAALGRSYSDYMKRTRRRVIPYLF